MKTCSQCKSEYNELEVNIPNPILDKMCVECGTLLTDEKIQTLIIQKNTTENIITSYPHEGGDK